MTTRAASALRATALAGALLLGAAGCAVFSPVQTDYAYQPADGPALDTGDLKLRNLVVVAAEKGGDGILVGQAVNGAAQAVQVSFSVGSDTPANRTVPASSGAALSAPGSSVVLTAVPGGPGDVVDLTVTTPGSGQNVVTVPVLAPTGYYTQFAPS
ncbi:hypothetical protein [Oryzobacter terrae]|uniref:hypothetical protein n=1 Tax=Oryzobacter terrae TaxID=1620385 RepID=UPI00366AA458